MGTLAIQLAAIGAAFALGFVMVAIFGFDPFEVYGVLWSGSVGSIENLGWSLQNMTPLVFTGLSVALAFRAGLFNIGAEGQLVAGAFCAAVVGWAVPKLAAEPNIGSHGFWIARYYPVGGRLVLAAFVIGTLRLLYLTFEDREEAPPEPIGARWKRAITFFVFIVALYYAAPHLAGPLLSIANVLVFPLALAAAAFGGALWAFLPAMLRARLGVSEVITTIMFNFLAALLASWLLTTATFKEPGAVPQTPAVAAPAKLSELSRFAPGETLSRPLSASQLNTGFVLALLAAVVTGWLLFRTTLGYELRALGSNPTAAAAAGVRVERNVVLAMLLSGALAGLGGAEQVLGVHHHFVKDFWIGLGFTGIAVALVGRSHPIGVVAAAFLFGALQNGAVEIDMMTLFPRELILVLQALIIFLVASGPALADRLRARSGG